MATKRTKVPANANASVQVAKTPAAAPASRAPSSDAIAARAYEIWRQSGGAHGHDQADWFQAERELGARQAAR